MKALLGLSLAEIQEIVNQHGLPKFTAKQLTEWIYKKHCGSFDEMTNLSKATRQLLSENYTTGYRDFTNVQESKDGTKKYLFPGGRWGISARHSRQARHRGAFHAGNRRQIPLRQSADRV